MSVILESVPHESELVIDNNIHRERSRSQAAHPTIYLPNSHSCQRVIHIKTAAGDLGQFEVSFSLLY